MAALEEADALCLRLFHQDEDGAISRLIEANHDRGARILEEWHALCSASFGEHRALCEELFQDVYVPGLRDAYMCLWRRDLVEFLRLGRRLGEKLARAGVPFVSYVAYLNLLKRSYAKVLADKPDELPDLLNHVDTIHSALVSICAESYYRAIADADRSVSADSERPKDRSDIADAPIAGMAAASEAMAAVFRKIRRVATNLAPVLIIGETGTGKELVARAIHDAGPRRQGPFVAINCAALPRELIESELFGYRRGAFSGAVAEYLGLFRAAAGGTLLLDEVTEMAPELQAKLLRVLQDRTVRPVGAVTEVPIDVRIIASTNRDPDTAMASRLLRPDLYYRLSSSRIVVPPLRVRPDDIPVLVAHCLGLLADRLMRPPRVTPEGIALLQAQPWPGNVRELFNVLEETVTMSAAADIGPDELQWASTVQPFTGAGTADAEIPTLAAAERHLIERALASNDGNKLRAARQLGISRTKLYAKIAKYGLCEVPEPERRDVPSARRVRTR